MEFFHTLPNEVLSLGFFLILATSLLFALKMGKEYVIAMVAVMVVLANIFVLKPFEIFGITTYGGNEFFGAIFLATDLLAEYHGKKEAQKAVRAGFVSLFLYFLASTVYTTIDISTKVEDLAWANTVNDAISTIFTPAFGIIVASLTAFTLSNTFDIYFYEWIKSKTGEKHLWFRNNASTFVSQFIDTCTFSFIAVYFGFFEMNVVWQVILFAYIFKVAVAILDTPFMYLSKVIMKK